jgi:hypothetical protein
MAPEALLLFPTIRSWTAWTLKTILKQAEITDQQFNELLEKG